MTAANALDHSYESTKSEIDKLKAELTADKVAKQSQIQNQLQNQIQSEKQKQKPLSKLQVTSSVTSKSLGFISVVGGSDPGELAKSFVGKVSKKNSYAALEKQCKKLVENAVVLDRANKIIRMRTQAGSPTPTPTPTPTKKKDIFSVQPQFPEHKRNVSVGALNGTKFLESDKKRRRSREPPEPQAPPPPPPQQPEKARQEKKVEVEEKRVEEKSSGGETNYTALTIAAAIVGIVGLTFLRVKNK